MSSHWAFCLCHLCLLLLQLHHLTVTQPACTLINGAIAGSLRLRRHLAFQTIPIGTPICIPIKASVGAHPV
ncbi:Uncharacterized protein HZ326_1698 [Fusarium oxysporum f. sp. albedinis]|nr:Uncharacterized protein HZ326_1698 [Fusarium oxysporum f. sp. albedinis]